MSSRNNCLFLDDIGYENNVFRESGFLRGLATTGELAWRAIICPRVA
jgi:hypothetical protein